MNDEINGSGKNMRFHFRMKLTGESKKPPYLDFDTEKECPVVVAKAMEGDKLIYIIHVWLMEVSTLNGSTICEDYIFVEEKNNCEKISCKIISHKKKPDGEEVEEEEEEDLVYELMPAEYPAG